MHGIKRTILMKDLSKKKDYFCPTIKQMCVGRDCAFWLSPAEDDSFIGDHP